MRPDQQVFDQKRWDQLPLDFQSLTCVKKEFPNRMREFRVTEENRFKRSEPPFYLIGKPYGPLGRRKITCGEEEFKKVVQRRKSLLQTAPVDHFDSARVLIEENILNR